MEYIVTSNKKVCGKVKDEKLTRDDILSAGGNVEFLIQSGHITIANTASAPKAIKEVPAVKQDSSEKEEPVFNLDNPEGEK